MIDIKKNPETVGKLKVGTSAATPADGELLVSGNLGVGCDPDTKVEVNGDAIWLGNASSNASGRILFNEDTSSNGTSGFSLLYAGSPNPTLDGTTFTAAANEFHIFRHNSSAAGAVAMSISRGNGLCTFSSGINLGDTDLSNYAEGTWTPTLPNGGTLQKKSATYTRIGNICHLQFYVSSISPTANTSQFRIGGLPFTVSDDTNYFAAGIDRDWET